MRGLGAPRRWADFGLVEDIVAGKNAESGGRKEETIVHKSDADEDVFLMLRLSVSVLLVAQAKPGRDCVLKQNLVHPLRAAEIRKKKDEPLSGSAEFFHVGNQFPNVSVIFARALRRDVYRRSLVPGNSELVELDPGERSI